MSILETYYELPHPVGVMFDTLGRDYVVQVKEMAVTIRFPRRGGWYLVAPDFEIVPADHDWSETLDSVFEWGMVSREDPDDKTVGVAWIHAVGLSMGYNAGGGQAASDMLTDAMEDWWPSLCDWIEVLTRQVHAAPGKTLVLGPHHPSWVKSDGVLQRLFRRTSGRITLGSDGGPEAPVALTVESFEGALARATSGPPPTEWLLIRDGRLAHQQGSRRRAVIDAGTAVELAITKLLKGRLEDVDEEVVEQLLAGHRMLRNRTKLLTKLGGTLPPGTMDKLVEPRNRATHGGANPPPNESHDALVIASEIVNTAYPLPIFQ